jgi:hypothetical protein
MPGAIVETAVTPSRACIGLLRLPAQAEILERHTLTIDDFRALNTLEGAKAL